MLDLRMSWELLGPPARSTRHATGPPTHTHTPTLHPLTYTHTHTHTHMFPLSSRTSWEFPEITSGKYTMVSDADGKQYPWYGAKHELATLEGPTHRHTLTIDMNDNFFPQVGTGTRGRG